MKNPFSALRSPLLGSTAARIAKGTLLSAGIAAAALLAGGEAKAQPSQDSCFFGGFGGGANPCDGMLIIDDKKFTWEAEPPGEGIISAVWETDPTPDDYVLNIIWPGNTQGGSFNYVLEVTDPKKFLNSALLSVNEVGSGDSRVTKIISSANFAEPVVLVSIDGEDEIGGPLPRPTQKIDVHLSWETCPECAIASISDTYTQTQVPGPLPILGAAAAFGTSRRIRSRIKARSGVDTTVA